MAPPLWGVALALALCALALAPSVTAQCNAYKSCGICTNSGNLTCNWCGTPSTGVCVGLSDVCPPSRDSRTLSGRQCPPSARQIGLPIVIVFSVISLAVVIEHLVSIRFCKLPLAGTSILSDYSHLRSRDLNVIADLRSRVLWADYQRPRKRHETFVSLLASASTPVIVVAMFQERLGFSSFIFTAAWALFCVFLLVQKIFRRPRLYVLTEDDTVVVTARHCGMCGERRVRATADAMRFVSVRSYQDGYGSVYFQSEDPAGTGEDANERLYGFDDIVRSEEVYAATVAWRCGKLGLAPPAAVRRAPERKPTAAELCMNGCMFVGLLAFILGFLALFISQSRARREEWLIFALVFFGGLWLITSLFYAIQRFKLRRRYRDGFLVLDQEFAPASLYSAVPMPEYEVSHTAIRGHRMGRSSSSSDEPVSRRPTAGSAARPAPTGAARPAASSAARPAAKSAVRPATAAAAARPVASGSIDGSSRPRPPLTPPSSDF